MRLLMLALVACLSQADTITETVSLSVNPMVLESGQTTLPPFFLDVPQFNPALGTLNSISYTFSDFQQITWGYNDENASPGMPFQVLINETAESSTLPIDANGSMLFDETTSADHRIISEPCCFFVNTLDASGETSDVGSFIGVGILPVDVTTGAVSALETPDVYVFTSVVFLANGATLDLTYNYTPIPEPHPVGMILMVGAAVFLAASSKARFMSKSGGKAQKIGVVSANETKEMACRTPW